MDPVLFFELSFAVGAGFTFGAGLVYAAGHIILGVFIGLTKE